MSFYSDIVHGETFSGGTYWGNALVLGGTVTGMTYNGSDLTLHRVAASGLTVTLGIQPLTGVSTTVFANYTASTDALLSSSITGVSQTDLFSMTAYAQNIYVELKPTGVTPGTYGDATTVPVLTVNQKGYITSATTVALSTASTQNNLLGVFQPGHYYTLPYIRSTGSIGTTGVAIAGRFVCYPFHVSRSIKLFEMGVILMTASAAQSVKLAVYNAADQYMSSLVADYGTIFATVAGYRGLLLDTVLSADTYFACLWGSASVPTAGAETTSTQWGSIQNGTSASNAGSLGLGYTATIAQSGFPAIYSATTTVITSFTTPAAIFLRFTGAT